MMKSIIMLSEINPRKTIITFMWNLRNKMEEHRERGKNKIR